MAATLVRPRRGKVFAGVCAALADRFEVPRAFVRVGFMFFGLFGVGEFVYIALWIIIPQSDYPPRRTAHGAALITGTK
ncbi:PspC domain-containing protein [Arthrobacter sp. ES3-54]|uniref:PspC domain-containing protein n=1 Tax=Arthrobacter sp. ES3-54 TaxID=1502991 RepID=UPI00240597C5|nr:PspC domain-containing protein [Arthrobacter sp. ES3-54]MDF9751517.1 phage shock protein C [Arthrobacter sp. ES3-54]